MGTVSADNAKLLEGIEFWFTEASDWLDSTDRRRVAPQFANWNCALFDRCDDLGIDPAPLHRLDCVIDRQRRADASTVGYDEPDRDEMREAIEAAEPVVIRVQKRILELATPVMPTQPERAEIKSKNKGGRPKVAKREAIRKLFRAGATLEAVRREYPLRTAADLRKIKEEANSPPDS